MSEVNASVAGGEEKEDRYMVDVKQFTFLWDLVQYLNKDLSALPEWEQVIVQETKLTVQYRLRDHFESNAGTRSMFSAFPEEQWKEAGSGLFNLTETPKQILGNLTKQELTRLDNLVKAPWETKINELRAVLDDIMDAMRASESDRGEIADVMITTTNMMADIEAHQAKLDIWQELNDKKVPIIKELAEREEFLEEVDEFEKKASGDADRYKKSNSLALAQENKFRAYAAKKVKELDSKAIASCRRYKAETGRVLEIDGVDYLEMIKEQKFGRSSHQLSLTKLPIQHIPDRAKKAYALYPATPDKGGMGVKKKSMVESGENPNTLIKEGRH